MYNPATEGQIPSDYYNCIELYRAKDRLPFVRIWQAQGKLHYEADGSVLPGSHLDQSLRAWSSTGIPEAALPPGHPFLLHYIQAGLRQTFGPPQVYVTVRNLERSFPLPVYPEPEPEWGFWSFWIHNTLIHPLLPVARVARKIGLQELAGFLEYLHD